MPFGPECVYVYHHHPSSLFVIEGYSEAASAGPLLFMALLGRVGLETHLDCFTFSADVRPGHILSVHVIVVGVVARDCAASAILSLGVVLTAAHVASSWLNTDVLLLEVFRGKLIQEVLLRDAATLFISILQQNLIEALNDSLHNLLEAETHSLFVLVVGSNVLLELLINLLNDPVEPVAHVSVSKLDLFGHFGILLVEFLGGLNLDVEMVNLGVSRAITTLINVNVGWLLIRVVHLQLVEFLRDLLVLAAQVVQLLFVLADGLQKLRIGGLTGEELLDDMLDVREASLSTNLLEGSLDLLRPAHLPVHLRLQEGAPELLRKEVFIHLELVAIFVIASGLVTDLLLTIVTLVATLKGRLLVVE